MLHAGPLTWLLQECFMFPCVFCKRASRKALRQRAITASWYWRSSERDATHRRKFPSAYFFFSFCLPLTRPLSMSPSSSLFLTQIALPLGSRLARMFSDRLSRQRECRIQTKGHPDCLVRSMATHAHTHT